PEAYSWISTSLVRAGLPNAASYFFIRALQSNDKTAIRRVLSQTQEMLVRLGADLFRRYLINHTHFEDYDAVNRSAHLYALGKDALLSGDTEHAIGYLNGIRSNSPLWGFALQLRGTAHALAGKNEAALRDFDECVDKAKNVLDSVPPD